MDESLSMLYFRPAKVMLVTGSGLLHEVINLLAGHFTFRGGGNVLKLPKRTNHHEGYLWSRLKPNIILEIGDQAPGLLKNILGVGVGRNIVTSHRVAQGTQTLKSPSGFFASILRHKVLQIVALFGPQVIAEYGIVIIAFMHADRCCTFLFKKIPAIDSQVLRGKG